MRDAISHPTLLSIRYEDNQDLANAFDSYTGILASGKSMSCSFVVNGIPARGSFTVVTNKLMGYGTTVEILAGIFVSTDQLEMDAPMLISTDISRAMGFVKQQ
jgi:hypothetical protein